MTAVALVKSSYVVLLRLFQYPVYLVDVSVRSNIYSNQLLRRGFIGAVKFLEPFKQSYYFRLMPAAACEDSIRTVTAVTSNAPEGQNAILCLSTYHIVKAKAFGKKGNISNTV